MLHIQFIHSLIHLITVIKKKNSQWLNWIFIKPYQWLQALDSSVAPRGLQPILILRCSRSDRPADISQAFPRSTLVSAAAGRNEAHLPHPRSEASGVEDLRLPRRTSVAASLWAVVGLYWQWRRLVHSRVNRSRCVECISSLFITQPLCDAVRIFDVMTRHWLTTSQNGNDMQARLDLK